MTREFFVALGLYLLIFLIIGVLDLKKIKNFTDYSVAGKNQSLWAVIMIICDVVIAALCCLILVRAFKKKDEA